MLVHVVSKHAFPFLGWIGSDTLLVRRVYLGICEGHEIDKFVFVVMSFRGIIL